MYVCVCHMMKTQAVSAYIHTYIQYLQYRTYVYQCILIISEIYSSCIIGGVHWYSEETMLHSHSPCTKYRWNTCTIYWSIYVYITYLLTPNYNRGYTYTNNIYINYITFTHTPNIALKYHITHNTTQHNTTQHNTTQHNTPHRTAPHRTAPHRTAPHRTTTHHDTPRHTTPHHTTTRHDTTQHDTTQHNTTSTTNIYG